MSRDDAKRALMGALGCDTLTARNALTDAYLDGSDTAPVEGVTGLTLGDVRALLALDVREMAAHWSWVAA